MVTSKIGNCKADRIYNFFNIVFLSLLLFIVAYPLYFIIIASVSTPAAVGRGKVAFWPDAINLSGYKTILEYEMLWIGYRNSVIYTVLGTVLSVMTTMCCGYVFTRRDLPFRKFLIVLFVIPMFFSGGLIPTYLIIRDYGLLDNPLLLIIISCVSTYNIIIARTFIDTNIPKEMFEAARIDGSNNISYFIKMVIPLSKALIAVLSVFAAVGYWNNYFNALIYITTRDYLPLQNIIREILSVSTNLQKQMEAGDIGDDAIETAYAAESIKYGVIIVSSLPMMAVYPFAQKYFVKGVMIGAIKG